MIDPELQQRFRELLKATDAWRLEYEEKHGDAGDAYTHCVTESSGVIEALTEYIQVNFPSWTFDEVQSVVGEFDKWSFNMEPGHRFSDWGTSFDKRYPDEERKGCCVWSAAIEEVEEQYDVKCLAQDLDCEVEDVRELVLAEKEYSRSDFCIGHIYRPETFDTFETYQCTDACWFAVVPADWFTEKIEEVRERNEENSEVL